MASHPAAHRASTYRPAESAAPARRRTVHSDSSTALLGVTSVLLGLLVAALGLAAVLMWVDAHNARDGAAKAASAQPGAHDMAGMAGMADMPGA